MISQPNNNIFNKEYQEKLILTEKIYIGYPRFEKLIEKIRYIHMYSKFMAEPECMLITGNTGAGKTTLYKQYISKYKTTINKGKTKIPILMSTIPAPATVKSVLQNLLTDLGDIFPHKGSISAQTTRLNNFIRDCGVELIILDEFQHLIDRDSKRVLRTVADWLKVIIIETRIPVILFGMPESEAVLNANPQLSRRFSNRYTLEPFGFETSEQQNEFRTFLMLLDRQLPLKKMSHLSDPEMAFKIYYSSDGTVGYVMKLIRKATLLALQYGQENITKEILGETFDLYLQRDKYDKENPFKSEVLNKNAIKIISSEGISNRMKNTKKRDLEVKDVL